MEVEVRSLRKTFGSFVAVKDVHFRFSAGQIVGFIGPNGAGKTTTIKMMATLIEPSAGDIFFDRTSITEEPEMARRVVGYMPDALPTHRDMTVHDYIDFFARAYGLKGAKRRQVVEQVEEFTQLTDLRDKYLFALSKGMKQRVSLARALVHDPKVLILDEPAAGLDPRARIELRELLKILADQGKAVLLSSHILTELSELCTHAVFIERGRVLRAGALDSLADADGSEGKSTHERAAVASARRTLLAIRVLQDTEGLLKQTQLLPHVESVRPAGRHVEVEVAGGDQICYQLLQELIRQGFQVVEFHQQGNRLEELFMNITKGQVQ